MKIVHLPGSYLPHTVGGKEVYTHSLAKALTMLGHENCVLIHKYNTIESSYEYDGIHVEVVEGYEIAEPHRSLFTRTVNSIEPFVAFIKNYKPDIVHFHDQSGGASLSHLRAVKQLGIKTVLTFHTPGQLCPQRALLYNGKQICNGKHIVSKCTSCQLVNLGLPEWVALLTAISPFSKNFEPKSKLSKLLLSRKMTELYFGSFNEFTQLVDGIQIYANWAVEMFKLNRVDEKKIFFFRTAGKDAIVRPEYEKFPESNTLKIVFAGRCTVIKGVHVLVGAILKLDKKYPVEVYFLGPYWDTSDYGKKLIAKTKNDNRFKTPYLVPNADILQELSKMDICVIPSLWLETGPIAVFDAFAAGIPVIGSDSGGIAELVENGKTGLLFKTGDSNDLAEKLESFFTNPQVIKELISNLVKIRTMKDVAIDTQLMYKNLLNF